MRQMHSTKKIHEDVEGAHPWNLFYTATKRLKFGTELYVSYGSGSSEHDNVAAIEAAKELRSPIVKIPCRTSSCVASQ